MKTAGAAVLVGVAILGLAGCTESSRSPDAIRHDTAAVTESAARDTKAVAQGVFDGLRPHKGPMDINTASSSDLQSLPGMDVDTADRIVANRPYRSTQDLLRRHLVAKAEYNKIADRIATN